MAYGLEDFCRDAHDALIANPGHDGREKVRQKLEKLLANPVFVAENLADAAAGKEVLHHDPETGFYVLAHGSDEYDRVGKPHDHGESWAIYGQATGVTEMTAWRRLDDSGREDRAELEVAEKFTLTPGVVALFDSGAIHSTAHPQPARWVRVTGADLDRIRRFRYDPEKQTMSVMNGGAGTMGYGLEEFAADTHDILQRDPGPAGREKVCAKLATLLEDDDFIAAYCGPDAAPGARVIHHDPETDFNVLVHIMEKDHEGWPHDHGSSWAIYGQAVKHTDMTVWRRLDDGAETGRADLERDKTFRLDRATVGVFNEGTIHSIAYPAGARFVRVTGTDLSQIERQRFDPENGTVVSEKRPIFGAVA